MAALVAVDAQQRGAVAPSDPVGLSSYLLDREHDFWHALHDNAQIATLPLAMGRTVFTATLTQALSRSEAIAAIDRAAIVEYDACSKTLDDHAVCYPAPGADANTVLEPLYPDRLGEDFLALTIPGHPHSEYDSDKWAEDAVPRLLAPNSSLSNGVAVYVRPALTALIETAQRWPHVANRQLYPLLHSHPQLALAAGGPALAALAERPDISIELLEAIESLLPSRRNTDLDVGIAALTQRLVSHRLATTHDPAKRARMQLDLFWRLSNAGQQQPAMVAVEEATQVYRKLVLTDSLAHEPGLAMALDNLATWLSRFGRQEEALAAAAESTQIRRRLAAADPYKFEYRLAESLNTLSNCLSELERRDEALAATEEAVQIRRRLAVAEPATFEPGLATELASLGNRLAGMGRGTRR